MDPIVGNASDNTRTPWGRRRPFMVAGAILTAFIYLLMWRIPTGVPETTQLIYLFIVGLLFFTSCTCWSMPFTAMQMELTPNYDERTRLMAWTALFGKCFGLLGGWSMAIVTGPWFVDITTGKPDILRGMQVFSIGLAALILVLGLLPAILGREIYYEKEASQQSRQSLYLSIKESVKCGPLWSLVGIAFFLMLGSVSVGSLGQYINIYYVNDGRIADASVITGWKASVLVATGIICIPLWIWLAERFDKRTIVFAMIVVSILGHLLYIFCLRPEMPYLQLLPAAFEAGALSAIWIFLPSMKADIADFDELKTSLRREGSLNALYSWFFKLSFTVGLGLSGVILQTSGFNAKLSHQPDNVLNVMFFIFIILPVALWSITLAFLWRYPLNREVMTRIRSELEQRRGVV